MPADFPVPRSDIPRVEVSADEYLARKVQMEGMVDNIVQEYEEFSEVNKRFINLRRWKQVGSRERCKLYRERPQYQTSVGTLGAYGATRKYSQAPSTGSGRDGSGSQHGSSHDDDNSSEHSYAASSSSRSSSNSMRSGNTGFSKRSGAVARARRAPSATASIGGKLDPQRDAAVIADTMPKMLMIGERPGRLEDAMHSLVARNHEELAFVVVFLHKDVADCSILHTMESPTPEEPYRYMGYKWFVKPSPATAISKVLKNRDSLYIEYTGITATASGEVVGYHIMHSIDIDGFPNFHDRNCLRASQSMCSLYYQKEPNMVEFFMMGNIDIGGSVGQSPFKSIFIADAMFGMPRSIDAGEAKRLTELVVHKRRARAFGTHKLAPLCRLCRSEKKSFNRVSLVMCEICSSTVCSRCRVEKEVFESDGLLGRFNKFHCCKTCVVDISNTHLPPATPQVKRLRGGTTTTSTTTSSRRQQQSSKPSTRNRNWTATSATLYEDEEDDHDDHADHDDHDQQSLDYEEYDEDDSPEARLFRMHRDQSSKRSAASDSTVSTEVSSQRTIDSSRVSTVSEVSDFAQSFAIIRDTAAQGHVDMNYRDTQLSRDTAFSIDDLADDWQPEFAHRFSKKEPPMARSHMAVNHHHNDMVLYTNGKAGHYHHHHHQHQAQSNHRGGGGGAGGFYRLENQYNNNNTQGRDQYEQTHETQLTCFDSPPRVHNMAPAAGPVNLQRNHSGGSDYSRDDLINRMQHLAQLAEATYNTTKDNESRVQSLNKPALDRQQSLENKNRFFYY